MFLVLVKQGYCTNKKGPPLSAEYHNNIKKGVGIMISRSKASAQNVLAHNYPETNVFQTNKEKPELNYSNVFNIEEDPIDDMTTIDINLDPPYS